VSENSSAAKSLPIGLAFIAGIGLILMVIVAGIGVVSGDSIDPAALNLLFALGTATLIAGIIAWFVITRPDTHFDDINEPMYHGHHDEH
jgi:hypothetical protein